MNFINLSSILVHFLIKTLFKIKTQQIHKLKKLNKSGKENSSEESKENNSNNTGIYQYILEWELKNDLDEEDFINLLKFLNKQGFDLNLNSDSKAKPKNFNHPIRTLEGTLEYRGHFENSGIGFLGDSLISIQNPETKEKRLRLTLNYFGQDIYIFLISQISHYLKTKTFIDRKQLYFNIYYKYNQKTYEGNRDYDISFFSHQYSTLMEKLIIPHSLEGNKLGIKPSNVLLSGIYGSGKSQFLLKILKNRDFLYKGKNFKLNANVISIDLQSFKSMLINGFGGFRTRIDEIYQNTGVPVIMVIEDIDTIINEKIHGTNDEIAQAMTVFFEGIGSVPVSVIATANDPSKLSERLIRPNRIYNIIEFYLPNKEEKVGILKIHLQEKGLKISEKAMLSIQDTLLFKKGTASHIAEFVQQIYSKKKTEELFLEGDYILTDEEILQIAQNINIPTQDIEKTIKITKDWISQVTGKNQQQSIGFTS